MSIPHLPCRFQAGIAVLGNCARGSSSDVLVHTLAYDNAFWYHNSMIFLDVLVRLLKGKRNANRVAKHEDVRQRHDGGGVYRFASAAERTISDCRRIGLLAATVSAQSGGDADCSPRDKVRKLTDRAIVSLPRSISNRRILLQRWDSIRDRCWRTWRQCTSGR